ncbi:tetraacyldisaccharide 4'-kinase [Sediminibacter sp. Hel_I_10]|uniref:tetraacyldisaccharide 4'-kinase n=1 Tax=Sediminibacter sp. Hel_I_10 TaxID=1392490 RepID=UPI00047E582B|nr:tetraacyldisaccharide 4'-kinase [Sediminibacter sp. Hel_I_10]
MKLLRKILFPFVPFYFLVTWIRNTLYDHGIKRSRSYDFPLICVGNLSVGGTGKTPMIEYLIRLLKSDHKIATLSRGYGRKTSGFVLADEKATALTIGDEPFQFYKKFEDVLVSVDANRRAGISILRSRHHPEVILLDDAFQHRKVKAGLNILLTPHHNLYSEDMLLPTGNLREARSGAKRADLIVVTKCPSGISEAEKLHIVHQLRPNKEQQVYFSWITYSDFIYGMIETKALESLKKEPITVVTGIANPKPFLDYLDGKAIVFDHLNYKDHHEFSVEEINLIKKKPFILTTEKDFGRLKPHFTSKEDASKLWYLPIEFALDKEQAFSLEVKRYVKSY